MAVIDTTEPSLTLIKSFTYRGAPEEWGNTYFFEGPTPSSAAEWKALADAVIVDEKGLYDANTAVVKAIGHQAGQSVAVWSYDYAAVSEEVPGILTVAADVVPQGGDSAAWIRWSTDALTSKGKPIYLRSYFHPAYASGSGDPTRDEVAAAWKTAAQSFGDAWIAGYTVDGTPRNRRGPKGVAGAVATPSTYVTTRTLERRGRRP